MNKVIQAIESGSAVQFDDGSIVNVHSGVSPVSGRIIRSVIDAVKPEIGCEVGLAFGISTLYILDAMSQNGFGRLIGMDPAQHDSTWRGIGLYNIRRAGFGAMYEFHEASSQLVLPTLAASGMRIQFGFIDGWHTFDHTLVDFFYMDMMMDVGGVIILDDVGYPGLLRLAHFILTNRAYSVLEVEAGKQPKGWRNGLKKTTQRVLHPLLRDDKSPSKQSRMMQEPVNGAQLVALRKEGEDTRRFDHFVPF